MKEFDTICAIATPVGVGGIAIIRVSGHDAEGAVGKIAFPKSGKKIEDLESHKLTLSDIKSSKNGEMLDEVLVVVMRGPNSYTGETVVEINCHGGYLAAESIMEELFFIGVRQAEAGEFTRRAFVNGKLDLARAEAVIDLIHANSEKGQSNAAKILPGKLSEKVNKIRDKAVLFAANISAVADYPDEVDEIPRDELIDKIDGIAKDIDEMLGGFSKGKIMRDGVLTVIAGRPNVGKSSLLNALTRTDRAIVTDIPGTTRDTVEEYVSINGIALRLIDTAGIRESENSVEKIGIERAKENIKSADLCLFVIDLSAGITPKDLEIFEYTKDKNVIVILNKTDIATSTDVSSVADELSINEENIILTSLPKEGKIVGIAELEDRITRMFMSGTVSKDDVFISNDRQKNALIKAKKIAIEMTNSVECGMPADMLYVDLEELIAALGEITGQTVQDEIIDKVFERFCVGK